MKSIANIPRQNRYVKTLNQDGFVSVIVAMIIMLILTLMSAGFMQIVQREKRQALDYQLSRQATYAAESGINEVIQAINEGRVGFTNPSKTNCSTAGLGTDGNGMLDDGGSVGDTSNDTAYTCVNYDTAPGDLHYTLRDGRSKFSELTPTSGNPLYSFTFTWGNSDASNNILGSLPACGSLSQLELPPSRNQTPPVLKVDLTKINSGPNPYVRTNLINDTDYFYFMPCDGGSSPTVSYDPSAFPPTRGKVVSVGCSGASSEPCKVTIDGLNVSNKFFVRVRPIYAGASLAITGKEQIPPGIPTDTKFANTQISVDVTARSNDIVRRLKASVPFASADADVPETVIQMFDGVCKGVSLDNVFGTGVGTNVSDTCKLEYGRP